MTQVIFNDKYNWDDMGIKIESISLQPPSKKKIKATVPFMHSSYDFSTVGSNGEIVFTERLINIRFLFIERNLYALYSKYSQILEWLLGVGQSQLVFTDVIDTYYLAEAEEAPSFEEVVSKIGRMDVKFIAEPFRYGVNLEGSDIWDTFNFETDYAQITEFDVTDSKTVTLYNPGRPVSPTINVDAPMVAMVNNYTISLQQGDNVDRNFILQPGANIVDIIGTGHIEFLFRKVLL